MNAVTEFNLDKIAADHVADLSDMWMEETDPENERGEVCTGLFDVSLDGETVTLVGLIVEDENGESLRNREFALVALGADRVTALEVDAESGRFELEEAA